MSNATEVIRAAALAAHKHRNQRREDADASPYINHPLALARVLAVEGGITDTAMLCAALLHDTIEDTATSSEEIELEFGAEVSGIVRDVRDDKALPIADRKRLQVERAAYLSPSATRVKMADKVCNLRDMTSAPPADWSLDRRCAYFDWAKSVIDGLRGQCSTRGGVRRCLQRTAVTPHKAAEARVCQQSLVSSVDQLSQAVIAPRHVAAVDL